MFERSLVPRSIYPLYRGIEAMSDERLEALRREEEELEHLRWLLSPDYWPRIYSVLARVREEIKEAEQHAPPPKVA